MIYFGYTIDPVFRYSTGKMDFQFFRNDNPEDSGLKTNCELSEVWKEIEGRLEEEKKPVYTVELKIGRYVKKYPFASLIEACEYNRYWQGLLLADFQNP